MARIQEKMLEGKMILVCYDFSDNLERAKLREELTSFPFYAKMMTQSVYYLPESVQSLRAVRKWANSSSERDKIVVFGDVNTTIRDQKKLVYQYYTHLQDIVQEVTDTTKRIRKELLEFEETIEYDEVTVVEEVKQSDGTIKKIKVTKQNTMRGWATKVSSIRNRFDEIRSMINKVGDEDDEFHLDMVATFVTKLDERYEKVRIMKEKINKEHKKKK